jgi:ABC-type Mn2+/Zn2+ transport system permease subunit
MDILFNRLGAVWLALLIATGMTAWIVGMDAGQNWATSAILAVAAVKIGLVMAWFMELRSAPTVWQIVFGVWLLVVSTLLIGSFIVI